MNKIKKQPRRRVKDYFVEVDPADVASEVTAQFMQGKISFTGYKGAVVMMVEEKRQCMCHPRRVGLFLYDNDFDALIASLRKAKRGWKKADNKAYREKLERDRERASHRR